MTASLLATLTALTIGLPVFALGERLRSRREPRPARRHASPARKETP